MTLPRLRMTGVVTAVALVAAGAALAAGPSQAAGQSHERPVGPTMDIQLLAFNDFHGNLEPPSGSSGRTITGHVQDLTDLDRDGNTDEPADTTVNSGGVAYLAAHLAKARQGHPYSLTVAAGDLIGASPLLSGAFHDEPSIEALNNLGLDVSAVGNHEFDEGYLELQRMAHGGCIDDGAGANNQNSCPFGSFAGAKFKYLAANVVYAGTNRTILPAYAIKEIKGAKIGFIGMTLYDTPSIVTASGVQGIEFKREVETANALVPVLRREGVKAIVVLIHQGGRPTSEPWTSPTSGITYQANPRYDWACSQGSLRNDGAIIPIAQQLDPQIDLIVSGHTHESYVCDIPDPKGQPRLVTSASSFGRLYTDTTLTYDRRTQDVVRASVHSANMVVDRTSVTPDATETSLIAAYKAQVAPIASKVIGQISADVTKAGNAVGESALGDLIADGQLADPSVKGPYATPVIALMNPGGIRTDLAYSASSWGEAPGDVTFEEAFTVQPFNNYLVSLDLTGAAIKDLLTQQRTGANSGGSAKVLQISAGFTYTYAPSTGTYSNVAVNGVPIVDTQVYRVVTNNFLADGGDNFAAFKTGTNRYFGGLDIDAFAAYLSAHSPYVPTPPNRITLG